MSTPDSVDPAPNDAAAPPERGEAAFEPVEVSEIQAVSPPSDAPVEEVPEASPDAAEHAETANHDPVEHEEPAAEPAGVPDPVADALLRIEAQLAENHRLLDRQTEIAGKLHAENQALRNGELRKAQQSLVISVLRVFDDVTGMVDTTEDARARNDLSIIADSLADALARHGVEPSHPEVGEPFDAKRHKIARIEPTDDPAANRTVAAVVRPGFTWSDGDIVRVAEVAVRKYSGSAAAPEPHDHAPEPEPAANDAETT